MPDREKVIKGLECCCRKGEKLGCEYCPYFSNPFSIECLFVLLSEALALLKAQDAPRADEAATETQEYCERYEPTYNPEDGSL